MQRLLVDRVVHNQCRRSIKATYQKVYWELWHNVILLITNKKITSNYYMYLKYPIPNLHETFFFFFFFLFFFLRQ